MHAITRHCRQHLVNCTFHAMRSIDRAPSAQSADFHNIYHRQTEPHCVCASVRAKRRKASFATSLGEARNLRKDKRQCEVARQVDEARTTSSRSIGRRDLQCRPQGHERRADGRYGRRTTRARERCMGSRHAYQIVCSQIELKMARSAAASRRWNTRSTVPVIARLPDRCPATISFNVSAIRAPSALCDAQSPPTCRPHKHPLGAQHSYASRPSRLGPAE